MQIALKALIQCNRIKKINGIYRLFYDFQYIRNRVKYNTAKKELLQGKKGERV
jgi:hypothetical protein